MTSSAEQFDVLVVGSGVAALDLSQKGYRVGVLVQGRRVRLQDMELANRSLTICALAERCMELIKPKEAL